MEPLHRKYRKPGYSTIEDNTTIVRHEPLMVGNSMDIEARIDEYLSSQYYVLWGQFFDIESKEGRRGAKEFILDLLIDLEITKEFIE